MLVMNLLKLLLSVAQLFISGFKKKHQLNMIQLEIMKLDFISSGNFTAKDFMKYYVSFTYVGQLS